MANTPIRSDLFRFAVGVICLLSGVAGLLGLYIIALPASNERPLLLGLGVVLGWGSAVVQSEFGSTTTGRKLAEKAVERMGE